MVCIELSMELSFIVVAMPKLRLAVHRKNEKRRKYGFYPIKIPLSAVLTIRIPLKKLLCAVSIPATVFTSALAASVAVLRERIVKVGVLPPGCIAILVTNNCVVINRVDDH